MKKIRNEHMFEAAKLHATEAALNQLSYKGMRLGACSSYFLDTVYYRFFNFKLSFRFKMLILAVAKSAGKRKYLKNRTNNVLYLKTAKERHYVALEEAVLQARSEKTSILVVGPMNHSELYTGGVFFHTGIHDLIQAKLFLLLHHRQIKKAVSGLKMSRSEYIAFWLHLLEQLLYTISARHFIISQKQTALIGADYDRSAYACCWFAAAHSRRIKTFTLQHGVINPPVGYAPLNADEIWVWGAMAKKQLMSAGVPNERIKLTGTPIIETLNVTEANKQKVKVEYKLNQGRTIVLALSRPDYKEDLVLVDYFKKIQEAYSKPGDNFVVKVHPSYPEADYSWIEQNYNLTLLPLAIPYIDFINLTDILLAYNSGIATEVLYYQKQVGILNLFGDVSGNGLELNHWLKVPILKVVEDFAPLNEVSSSQASGKELFESTGKEAAQNLASQIKELVQ
jgi:hypothetical protein